MKRSVKFTGVVLAILITGSVSLNAQRGGRYHSDDMRMQKPARAYDFRHKPDSLMKSDTPALMGMRRAGRFDNGMGQIRGWDRGFMPGQYRAGKPGMAPGRSEMYGRGFGPQGNDSLRANPQGRMGRIAYLQDLTDKQKKDISDLQNSQIAEMKKFREEQTAKIATMRDEHRNSILNLLTEEQKKAFGTVTSKPAK